ncbi:hypothetical protein [Streptomyces sp. NPDC001480]|uniref:hypothetical protein n=1 Tax=Streptomyces sp. NPDC001480 TaxID=3364577 RepID=UPI0036781925
MPRDWFRVDLTRERWRHQLKTFVDKETTRNSVPPEVARSVWTTLRNTAESSLTQGAVEFFLKTEVPGSSALPASLLISLVPMPPGQGPGADELFRELTSRADSDAAVEVVQLPAGQAVRTLTKTTMGFHVRMPGEVGYLLLAFSVPLCGTEGPMGNLCDAIAHSLRWV